MKPSERRKQMKDEMATRLQDSYNSKDDSGKFKSIFIKDAVGNIPKWKCSEDEHFINIIPYFAGKNNPNVKEGKLTHNLDIWVHGKVGINEDSYICLARSYGKKCPICDEQAEIRKQDDYDEKYAKSLNPSRRVIYNIECLDNDKEVKKGLQLFDVSHYLFGKELEEIAKKPRGGGFILYGDPDEGKIVFFRKAGSGPTNTKYSAFKFEDRDEPITDELLDSALVLDNIIHIPTYEEVYNAFHGCDVDSELNEDELAERRSESQYNDSAIDTPATDTGSRRPASRNTEVKKEEPKKEETAPSGEFVYPCTGSCDFGTFDACENCPDVAECEAEFNEAEEARLKAEQEKAEAERLQKEKETAAASSSSPAEGVSRRPRRGAPADAPTTQAATETAASESAPSSRPRRRPGA